MYPALSDIFNALFGTQVSFVIQTYGFFVAMAFLTGIWVLRRELKSRERRGLMLPSTKKVLIGAPATVTELILIGVLSLLIGYKVAGVIIDYAVFSAEPQSYIFSYRGSIFGGLAIAAGFVIYRWFEKKKKRLPEPEWREIAVYPHEHTGNLLIIAAIGGIAGAKVFHNLEHFGAFIKDPLGQLFSFMGLTFYGGLIVGMIALLFYAKRHKLPLLHLLDSTAPALTISYGLGRLGCMLSGDGCWGIVNNNPKSGWLSWLPDWMWSFDFPHNVINEGIALDNCTGKFCTVLEHPVYPTAFYDFVIMMLFFIVLISIRNRISIPGYMFSIFLVFIGVQRFLIEKIRVNEEYEIFSLKVTQAEIISVVLVILGGVGFWYFRKLASLSKKKWEEPPKK